MVRDIAYYGNNAFEKVLDIEQPVAVILLSTDTFAHRAFIRYCKQRAIPTLNLYHGLVNVQDSAGESGAYKVSRLAHVRYVFSKLSKLFQHTFPCYIKALIKTKATWKDWYRFFLDIYKMATGNNFFRQAAADAKTTKCGVYVQADVEHAMRCYGFKNNEVFVVGNPDFLQFGLDENMIGHWVMPTTASKTIMYIECGFSSGRLFFSSEQDFATHLINTSKALAAQGYKMLLKLKPHQINIELIKAQLHGSGIELITNDTFLAKLMACSACIVETTSLAMVPTLMGMPLLMAKYGNLKSLSYGKVLTSYPQGYFLESVADVTDILLKNAQTSDSGKLNDWIDLNVGPLPPEKMPERVVDIIKQMITEKPVVSLK